MTYREFTEAGRDLSGSIQEVVLTGEGTEESPYSCTGSIAAGARAAWHQVVLANEKRVYEAEGIKIAIQSDGQTLALTLTPETQVDRVSNKVRGGILAAMADQKKADGSHQVPTESASSEMATQ